jgi:hypothetical protein
MPFDMNSEGDNPFFVGHREQDNFVNSGGKNKFIRTPSQQVARMLRVNFPQASTYQLDRIKKQLEGEGSLAYLGQPIFLDRVIEIGTAVLQSRKVVDKYIGEDHGEKE